MNTLLTLIAAASMGLMVALAGMPVNPPPPRYWTVPLDSLALGRAKHTHVEIRGYVVYTRLQDDGDLHIRLVTDLARPTPFVIAECIPRLPCTRPRAGADIIIRGISRKDPEHGWWELHPVDSWEYSTAGE